MSRRDTLRKMRRRACFHRVKRRQTHSIITCQQTADIFKRQFAKIGNHFIPNKQLIDKLLPFSRGGQL